MSNGSIDSKAYCFRGDQNCNTRPSLSAATVSLVQQVVIELSHTIIADTFIHVANQQMVWLHVYRKA